MWRKRFAALAAMGVGCAPPPEVSVVDPDAPPSLEILHPEAGDTFTLDADCTLTEPIVVYVSGLELVPPRPAVVDGEGNWHGGTDLDGGYCLSSDAYCAGGPLSADYRNYDGTGMTAGTLTLFAQLFDNTHQPIADPVQVEVELVDPGGSCGGNGSS